MNRFMRTALFTVSALTISICCAKTDPTDIEDPTIPEISFGEIETVPAEGIVDGCIDLYIVNANGRPVKVSPDGKIVTAASCTETSITFTVSENFEYSRTGYIVVSCGRAAEILRISQKHGSILGNKAGWFELPAIVESYSYIYYTHDKCPLRPKNETTRSVSLRNITPRCGWHIRCTNAISERPTARMRSVSTSISANSATIRKTKCRP